MTTPPLTRRRFLRSAGLLAASAAAGSLPRVVSAAAPAAPTTAPAAAPGGFSFVHMTDVHVQPELGAVDGLRQCVAAINKLTPRPDFVVTGGDLIMDALAVGADRVHQQWACWDEGIKGLELPNHLVIGNHDVVGWSTKALVAPGHADYGKRIFAERYGGGRTYRSFDHKGWHFVLLDSIGQAKDSPDYVGLIDDAQLDWLKADLERAGKATPIVLVTHIPFYSMWDVAMKGPEVAIGAKGLVTNVYKFRKLLRPYNVRLVLSGHGHVRERIELDHQVHIQGGAVCGMWWKGGVNGDAEAFGVVDCQRSGGF
ncbi:MAG TPA: metallophosphoesterase, partial [Humisphaera sp.]